MTPCRDYAWKFLEIKKINAKQKFHHQPKRFLGSNPMNFHHYGCCKTRYKTTMKRLRCFTSKQHKLLDNSRRKYTKPKEISFCSFREAYQLITKSENTPLQ
jgi:hypothetical protein